MADWENDRLGNFDEPENKQEFEACGKTFSKRRVMMAGCGTVALLLTVGLIAGPTAAALIASSSEKNQTPVKYSSRNPTTVNPSKGYQTPPSSSADNRTPTSSSKVKPLKVAAFNIRHFGRSKMSKTKVANIIVNILNRYDLILVQEVRDKTGAALTDLWSRLNKTHDWTMVASAAIGRNRYKEQYVFFYKTSRARHIESFLIKDITDVYERDPFAAEFEYLSTTARERVRVVFLALHSRPQDAYAELVQLPHDITSVASHFTQAAGVISMGDFNADCTYISKKRLSHLQIFNNASFTSLIPHSADTTAGNSNCAYDRVIVYGRDVDARGARVFNFQAEYGLSDDVTIDVSDHYPVEFELF